MTLEQAIKHAEEVAEEQDKLCKQYDGASRYARSHNKDTVSANAKKCLECFECAKEHRQLAEWLKDYKRLLEQELCDEAISRQAAIDLIESIETERLKGNVGSVYAPAIKGLRALPPVTPQAKTGHWKRISMDRYTTHAQHWYECDKCGEHNLGDTNFCSNCGAKMD